MAINLDDLCPSSGKSLAGCDSIMCPCGFIWTGERVPYHDSQKRIASPDRFGRQCAEAVERAVRRLRAKTLPPAMPGHGKHKHWSW